MVLKLKILAVIDRVNPIAGVVDQAFGISDSVIGLPADIADSRDGRIIDHRGAGRVVTILESVSLGYNKVTVESPLLDEDGKLVLRKGAAVADTAKRDTENIPLDQDIDKYFQREVLPYRPGSWIDKSKTKVGYEIPFTRTFYEYAPIEPASDIAKRIEEHEHRLIEKLRLLFGNDGE